MIILHPDGALERIPASQRSDSAAHDSIVLPADVASQQSTLFDRVFTFAFDVLGLISIELRIRTADTTTL